MKATTNGQIPFEQIRSSLRIDYSLTSHLGISEERRFIQHIFADITLQHGDRREEQIGSIEAIKLLIGAARNNGAGTHLFNMDEDIQDIGAKIWDFEKQDLNDKIRQFKADHYQGSDILILDHIELTPAYRGKEIGRYAIKDLYNNFIEGCSLFVARLDPYRIEKAQDPEKPKSIARLVAFFNLVGFTMLPEVSTELMFMDPANINPSFAKLKLD